MKKKEYTRIVLNMVKLQDVENALLYIEPSGETKETDVSEYIWLVELFKQAKPGCGEIVNNKWTRNRYMYIINIVI